MLTAITRGKAGRVRLPDACADVSWRDVFRQREDLLTAVFFGRMAYLSDVALERVMGALVGDATAGGLGAWVGIEFWPRLQRLDGRNWVEPDVLLRFERATVMVEVKPPFGGDQSAVQWKAELEALVAEFQEVGSAAETVVHFVALGRTARVPEGALNDFDSKGLFQFEAHRVEWDVLARCIAEWPTECLRTDAAVCGDWLEAFRLFGLGRRAAPSWNTLAGWSAAHPLSEALPRSLPTHAARQPGPILTAAASSLPRWEALLVFSQQHPLEIQR
jgi:hypothetical protein